MTTSTEFYPPFTKVVGGLPPSVPFVAPEAIERDSGQALSLRLGANESCFGISPKARAAMNDAVKRTSWYADPESHELRSVLAQRHRVGIDNIVIGSGIDGLQSLVVRAFVEDGTNVVSSLGTYPTFGYHVMGNGGRLHGVPYRNDRHDLMHLIDSTARHNARLVYLVNPDNPAGTWHSAADIGAMIERLPGDSMLILDEAYSEFAPDGSLPDVGHPRVIHFRTFSKAYGMAGARIGYLIADRVVTEALNKIRNQFEVNRVAQAGALASLDDLSFVTEVVSAVAVGRSDYESLAARLGLSTIPSATNFVCIDMGGLAQAKAMLSVLQSRGVFIRMPGAEPLNRCIRVTVGTPSERTRFAEIFEEVYKENS